MLPPGYFVIYEESDKGEKTGDNITQGRERCDKVRQGEECEVE